VKLRSTLFILAGLLLVLWAASRFMLDVLPAVQSSNTPKQEVLENYAPNTGPLANTALPATRGPALPATRGPAQGQDQGTSVPEKTTASGETESQPVTTSPQSEGLPSPQSEGLPTLKAPGVATVTAFPTLPTTSSMSAATPESTPTEGSFLGGAAAPTPQIAQVAQMQAIPDRITIASIGLDAPVTLAASQKIKIGKNIYYQWLAPDAFAAGWHTSSATLGQPGNTVLDGHHNVFGKVFGRLVDLTSGDKIEVYSGQRVFHFLVTNKMILPERDVSMQQRLENARWIDRSDDIRLTLITCWPADSNTHRLIIVAVPDPSQP
jgi:LPXTG-site transpeptidase (sortase) family protein